MAYNKAVVFGNGTEITANGQVFIKSHKVISYEDTQTIAIFIVKKALPTYKLILNVISYLYKRIKLFFDMTLTY